jgi:tRNA G18 (ribose-2'-O)-methylase SpoU
LAVLRTTKALDVDAVIIIQTAFPAVNAKTAEVENFMVE